MPRPVLWIIPAVMAARSRCWLATSPESSIGPRACPLHTMLLGQSGFVGRAHRSPRPSGQCQSNKDTYNDTSRSVERVAKSNVLQAPIVEPFQLSPVRELPPDITPA